MMATGYTLDEAFQHMGVAPYLKVGIKDKYGEAHRFYHTLEHVSEMLRWIPREHPEVQNVMEAVIFHDIVYLPTPAPEGLDEALSCAEYLVYTFTSMHQHPQSGMQPFGPEGKGSMVNEMRVIEAITATSRHLQDQKNLCDVAKLVLDLDLSAFALPYEDYMPVQTRVEQDICLRHKLSAEGAVKARQDFLKSLLARKSLYYVNTHWEKQARDNMERDIAS